MNIKTKMSLGNFLETGNFRDFLRKSPLPILKPDPPEIDLFPGFYPFYKKYLTGYNLIPRFSKLQQIFHPETDRDNIKAQLQTIESRNDLYAFNLFVANEYQDYVSYIYFLNYYLKLQKKSSITVVTFNLWLKNPSGFLHEKDGMDFGTWKKEVDYENYVDYFNSLESKIKKPVEFDKWSTQGFFIKADSETRKISTFSDFEAESLRRMNMFGSTIRAEEITPAKWKNNGHYFRTENGYDDYISGRTNLILDYPEFKF